MKVVNLGSGLVLSYEQSLVLSQSAAIINLKINMLC
jgi:hypothetical protein